MRAAPLLLAFVLLLGAAAEPPPGGSPAPAADTLRFAMPSGEALVTALPADGSYRVLRAPALSWLVDRSFFWQTLPAERGREFVLLERRRGDRTDTLVLVVDVGSEAAGESVTDEGADE